MDGWKGASQGSGGCFRGTAVPQGLGRGSQVGKDCQQRVATLASTTWGLQSEPSLSMEKGVLELWGR